VFGSHKKKYYIYIYIYILRNIFFVVGWLWRRSVPAGSVWGLLYYGCSSERRVLVLTFFMLHSFWNRLSSWPILKTIRILISITIIFQIKWFWKKYLRGTIAFITRSCTTLAVRQLNLLIQFHCLIFLLM